LDWFSTLVAAAGNPNITSELLNGKKLGDQTYKVHLDGYNQLDLITGKGPRPGTRSSTSQKAQCARSVLTTYSPISPVVGLALCHKRTSYGENR
jgi:arylsulfatase